MTVVLTHHKIQAQAHHSRATVPLYVLVVQGRPPLKIVLAAAGRKVTLLLSAQSLDVDSQRLLAHRSPPCTISNPFAHKQRSFLAQVHFNIAWFPLHTSTNSQRLLAQRHISLLVQVQLPLHTNKFFGHILA